MALTDGMLSSVDTRKWVDRMAPSNVTSLMGRMGSRDPAEMTEPAACASCAVRHRSLCAALTGAEVEALNRISTRRTLEPGENFAIEGDPSVAFANILGGVAKLVRGMEDGREQIVGLLFPSDFIGRALVRGETEPTVPFTVQAATAVEVCSFPVSGFESVMSRYPSLEHKLLERTLSELDAARDWMLLLGRKTATERVATFLHHIARRCASAGCAPGENFDLPLTRADMADFTGLTIETVSRQMSKLRKDGILHMEGTRHVTRVDMGRLAERAGL